MGKFIQKIYILFADETNRSFCLKSLLLKFSPIWIELWTNYSNDFPVKETFSYSKNNVSHRISKKKINDVYFTQTLYSENDPIVFFCVKYRGQWESLRSS